MPTAAATARPGARPAGGLAVGGESAIDRFGPYLLLAALCLASLLTRPLLPPDETRYLTVAWEMRLHHGLFVPTLNGVDYHHKPPLLFWLIDAAWLVFGVGRFGAMAVVFGLSALCLHLTGRLARDLFPGRPETARRAVWMLLGSLPFLAYASLVLFDLMLTGAMLAGALAMRAFARRGGFGPLLLVGLALGLGTLAKGPVILVHLGWPAALYPLWRREGDLSTGRFLAGMGCAVLLALVPVGAWLVPALIETEGAFAYDLLWEQTAGRISGHMEASHPRSSLFYVLLLPVMALPWIALPRLRRTIAASLPTLGGEERRSLRLLLLWSLGTLLTFSLISGKQPHYILPIMPLLATALAAATPSVTFRRLRLTGLGMVAFAVAGQAVAAQTPLLRRFDLEPVAALMRAQPDAAWAVAGVYEGEFGFLARRREPLAVVADGDAWLAAHPGGYLVEFHARPEPDRAGTRLSLPYRDGSVTVREGGAG